MRVKDKRVIKSDTTPPPGEATGEFVLWGGKRYEVGRERRQKSKVVPMRDAVTGEPMRKRLPNGNMTASYHTERVYEDDYVEREYILVDLGNGQVEKNFNFRPDPAEAQRAEKEQRRKKFLDELFEKAEAAGGLDALLEKDEDEEESEFPKAKGAGWWQLSNGERVRGDEAVARAREAALHTSGTAA